MRKKFQTLFDKEAVLDTNTVIDLLRLKRLDLPLKIFSKAYVSSNALEEEIEEDDRKQLLDMGYIPVSLVTSEGYEMFIKLHKKHQKLSIPDKIIISIAYERKIVCCTNDREARKACEEIKVELSGTLGIICASLERGILTKQEFMLLINQYDRGINAHISGEIIKKIRILYNLF